MNVVRDKLSQEGGEIPLSAANLSHDGRSLEVKFRGGNIDMLKALAQEHGWTFNPELRGKQIAAGGEGELHGLPYHRMLIPLSPYAVDDQQGATRERVAQVRAVPPRARGGAVSPLAVEHQNALGAGGDAVRYRI